MMCEDNISKLKTMYDKCDDGVSNQLLHIFKGFLKTFPKTELKELSLDNYTNIKGKGDVEYFTHWIERKTEKCGKFRTSSSFAYGVYKVNANNIKNEDEKNKAESNPYRTVDVKSEKDVSGKYVSVEDAQVYFEGNVRTRLVELANFEDIDDTKPLDINYARKVAYMYNPDKLLPVYKKEVIETIADFLGVQVDCKSYKATAPILEKLKEVFDIKEDLTFEVTQKLMLFLWENFGKSVALDSKNIIFYGAPGTGKTYLTEKTIKSRIAFDNPTSPVDDYFKLVQFHPSYGYEDFIDGIKPAGMDSNGNLKFELVNGEFKEMCIQAFRNLVHTYNENREISNKKEQKKPKKPKKFYFLADEINRAELSRVFGELLLCLEEDKRLRFEDGELKGTKIKTQNSKLWEQKHAVVVMNGTTVVPVCETKEGILEWHEEGKEFFFGVPENLYFIGTMNDIDRSVDSFDMALRRRFLWKHYQCDYDVLVEHYKIEEDHPYIEACRNLNKHITGSGTEKNKGFDLGESYELGHSYFMKPKKLKNEQMGKVWEDHIAPLLKEYLRTTYAENEIVKKLKEAKKIFTLPKEKNVNSNR